MIDIYVLDTSLRVIGIIDNYKSLIWAGRYAEPGDCEIYAGATPDNVEILKEGNWLARLDDPMVCRIKKVEIETDAEDGNYIIATGQDAKTLLDQRIIWGTATCNGSVEEFVRGLVTDTIISPTNPARLMLKGNGGVLMELDAAAGLPAVASEQVSYKNVGDKIREYCATYGYGYYVRFDWQDRLLKFGMRAGADYRNAVIFAPDFDNLVSTKYAEDASGISNTALIGGQGEGADRILDTFGGGYGTERYEIFVDAKDLSTEITFGELKATYPLIEDGGTGRIVSSGGKYTYVVGTLDIQVMSEAHLQSLRTVYPGGREISAGGHTYYRITDAKAADLQSADPPDEETATLSRVIYDVYLLSRGQGALAETGLKMSFEGAIVPDVTFIYKQDYNLGDIVTVRNEVGIQAAVRITEMVEVQDDNGYSLEPELVTIEAVKGKAPGAEDLQTEDGVEITTEAGDPITA